VRSIAATADHLLLTASRCRGCRSSSFELERGRYGVLMRCRACELTMTVRVRCPAMVGPAAGMGRALARHGDVVCSGCGQALPLPALAGV
jgi:hypothetical protein